MLTRGIHAQRETGGSAPLQACDVGPTEVIYVPDNWWHATCNLDRFTLGVGARGDSSARPPHHDGCYTCNRAIYSNSAEIFKRPTKRKDSFDVDEHLTESIAATQTFI